MGGTLVLTHRWGDRAEAAFMEALRLVGLHIHDLDNEPITSISQVAARYEADTVITFWRFRHMAASDIDWRFPGGRLLFMDHDAWWDLPGTTMSGQWTEFLRRVRFDGLIVSGEDSAEHFRRLGHRTSVLHKGFDPQHFYPGTERRSGVCYYGAMYRSRRAMLRILENRGAPFNHVRAGYLDLGDTLRAHTGVIATGMGATVRGGKIGRAAERFRPGTTLRLFPSREPMLKHFEAAASGCAVITDPTTDLEALGFRNGETFIAWQTFDELADVLHSVAQDEQIARDVGERAAELCLQRHTWRHRADELVSLLEA
jgi:hypothetical protein